MANGEFSCLFEDCYVENIITTTSDHYAISIYLSSHSGAVECPLVQQGFRFEAMWLRAPDYKEVMEQAWVEGNNGTRSLQSTWTNLNQLAGSLGRWSKVSFGSVRKEIQKLERRIKSLRLAHVTDAVIKEERAVERRLCELFEREEIMAQQRSRVDWRRKGDKNTAFFHARASARRCTNKIMALVREDGSRCENQDGIKGMVQSF